LAITSLWQKCIPMSKTPRQLYPLFRPTITPRPYDKITAHLHRLHKQKKTTFPSGSSLIW
jgi:hypothetical protein